MSVTKAKTDNITSLNAAKLTGVLPAMSGAALTGIDSVTKNASDPTISTNPSGGVGTLWANTTSGEMYACTDATAGANVWINVGGGSGDVELWSYPGVTYGYALGGGSPSPRSNVKERWSFSSDGNSADAGDLSVARQCYSGYSSRTHGYGAGGRTDGSPTSDIVDKFPYASNGNSTDVGNLTVSCGSGSDSSSETHGYTSGGVDNASGNFICKTAYASDGNATDVGDTQQGRYGQCGHSSETHGYVVGGTWTGHSNALHIIEKFTFASDGNATDVGNLTTSRGDRCSGNSSATHGYTAGGHNAAAYTNIIDKHTFSSNANATDVGDLTQSKLGMAGAGSLTFGYWAGGSTGGSQSRIEKSSYATDGNSTNVGDCTVSVHERAGTQV